MYDHKFLYDELSSEFQAKIPTRLPADRKLIERFTKQLKNNFSSRTVLDVGPGNGNMLRLLYEAGCDVTAVEISPKMAKVAQENCPEANVIIGDFLSVDIDQKFSGIVACAFIHLFKEEQLERVLNKLEELLVDNGVLLVATTKHDRSYSEIKEKTNFSKPLKRFRRRFTKEELEQILVNKFTIKDYWENSDLEEVGKTWMNFTCIKK